MFWALVVLFSHLFECHLRGLGVSILGEVELADLAAAFSSIFVSLCGLAAMTSWWGKWDTHQKLKKSLTCPSLVSGAMFLTFTVVASEDMVAGVVGFTCGGVVC